MRTFSFEHTATDFSWTNAYWLARASRLAYTQEAKIKRETQLLWNDPDVVRFRNKVDADELDIEAALFRWRGSTGNFAILSFCGTERDLRDWRTDARFRKDPWDVGKVHRGFAEALDSIWTQARDSVKDVENLWLTGHSLGGALAVLAAFRLHKGSQPAAAGASEDPTPAPAGTYVYGVPRVGDRDFKRAYDDVLGSNTFCFVNDNDIVPRVPPTRLKYRHVGQLRFFDKKGRSVPLDSEKYDRQRRKILRGWTLGQLRPDSAEDHGIVHYVGNVAPNVPPA